MKAKQLAVNTFAALAVAALMAMALAHAGEHKGEEQLAKAIWPLLIRGDSARRAKVP